MNHEESCKVLCAKTYSAAEIKQFAEKAKQLPRSPDCYLCVAHGSHTAALDASYEARRHPNRAVRIPFCPPVAAPPARLTPPSLRWLAGGG